MPYNGEGEIVYYLRRGAWMERGMAMEVMTCDQNPTSYYKLGIINYIKRGRGFIMSSDLLSFFTSSFPTDAPEPENLNS